MNKLKRNLLFILTAPLLFGCNGTVNTEDVDNYTSANEHVLSILKETRTTQYFSDESVPLEDITSILDAGRNATSRGNVQPWYFGAIINQEVIADIAASMPRRGPPPADADTSIERTSMLPPSSTEYPKADFSDAPAAIALACMPNTAFDVGLACENMVIAATALGYGTKIFMGGLEQFNNAQNRALLEIPDNMSVVATLVVGKLDTTVDMTADGVTGASVRKPLNEISTVIH